MRRVLPLVVVLAGLAACGSATDPAEQAEANAGLPTSGTTSAGSSTVASTVSTSTTSTPRSTTTITTITTTTTTTTTAEVVEVSVSEPPCRPLADLENSDELSRWRVVNDGVMGGQSSAEATIADSVLSVAGEIVTDGGGFSSVRLALDQPLGEASSLVLNLRTDGRAYELTLSDAADGRDRRTSHQAPIGAEGGGGWEQVVVDFADLEASVFGFPVETDPFEPQTATEVGIILADGLDGPFGFDLDWIRVCP